MVKNRYYVECTGGNKHNKYKGEIEPVYLWTGQTKIGHTEMIGLVNASGLVFSPTVNGLKLKPVTLWRIEVWSFIKVNFVHSGVMVAKAFSYSWCVSCPWQQTAETDYERMVKAPLSTNSVKAEAVGASVCCFCTAVIVVDWCEDKGLEIRNPLQAEQANNFI